MSVEAAQSIPPVLVAQVESILYAAGEPASINAMATALETSTQDIELALEELARLCKTRGVRIQRHGNEAQLVTAPETAENIQRYLGLEAANRLSAAALETLAIIAYKQPMTKPQIEMIRGVNCDGVMKTLEMHNLIKELGRAETVGHPMRYGISFEFLEHFGLRDVHELPQVEKLEVLPRGDDSANQEGSLNSAEVQANPDQAVAPESDQVASTVEQHTQSGLVTTPDNKLISPAEEQSDNILPPAAGDMVASVNEQPENVGQTSMLDSEQVRSIESQHAIPEQASAPASAQAAPDEIQPDTNASESALSEIPEAGSLPTTPDESA
jgi:segregation and condensation protein B